MKMKIIPIVVIFLGLLNLAGATTAKGIALGLVSPDERETKPAQSLFALSQENPDVTVVGATGRIQTNENITDHYKWFYDKEKKVLVMMMRSVMVGLEHDYSWRVWYEVNPDDFKDRLPYGRDDIKTKGSPYKNPVQSFPISYKDNPKITEWP